MKVEQNHVVALSYELTVEGQVADRASKDAPLEYIHGFGMLLPRFEEEVEGKQPGDTYAFTLSPEEGYGVPDPQLRFDIPKSSFEIDGKVREDLLVVGRTIPMLNGAGQVCHAQIIEIKPEAVTVDFNHPMAGKTLHFTGEIVSVRPATEKELTEGLHGEFAPQEEEGHCCHGKGHCHRHEGEAEGEGHCCHGEGHGEGHCCHHDQD